MLNESFYKDMMEQGFIIHSGLKNNFVLRRVGTPASPHTIIEPGKMNFPTYETALDAVMDMMGINKPEPPPASKFPFDVIVFYNRGFGPECLNLARVEAANAGEAQMLAEKNATEYFEKNFRKHVWEEVKIRPAR